MAEWHLKNGQTEQIVTDITVGRSNCQIRTIVGYIGLVSFVDNRTEVLHTEVSLLINKRKALTNLMITLQSIRL